MAFAQVVISHERLRPVDSIVAELRSDAPPGIVHFELGFVPLARRINLRPERLAMTLRKRSRYEAVFDNDDLLPTIRERVLITHGGDLLPVS